MLSKKFNKVQLGHLPTPLESMPNLSKRLNGPNIWIKRDDTTGLAMGGNKVRQLEYYFGKAETDGCNAVLTTGAVQSNHVRQTIAAARKLGWYVEAQLERRVEGRKPEYNTSGNAFLDKLMGAKLHYYPVGEDEHGADKAMYDRAEELKEEGYKPYVIPLGAVGKTPWGSLGYVECMEELISQSTATGLKIDGIVVPTGSANTHAGILAGLTSLGADIPVYGFCVRRDKVAQTERVLTKTRKVLQLLGLDESLVTEDLVNCEDWVLEPGYGQLNDATEEAIELAAFEDAILLDPTYTGKSMAGLIGMIRDGAFTEDQNIVYLHTGGAPALFGYPELVEEK
ncbi:1-aminocyclopropane-1-carboxylate deaminase [Pseudovibrio japonicus]|uniref:1-aminocyclopropane-1-carboxylate deaminase n=1 Tax=Pseudovibrio japonicus TaxID=366534 RepID=A0ABQ3ENL5_9HYPH|nr:D-cysteine desulfhydrase family protein [Pseudovibrio japonicus]GHB43716.1 1-aminocyclopropane-1-carboxylate deaminase [Pseudovibrio japonicus]